MGNDHTFYEAEIELPIPPGSDAVQTSSEFLNHVTCKHPIIRLSDDGQHCLIDFAEWDIREQVLNAINTVGGRELPPPVEQPDTAAENLSDDMPDDSFKHKSIHRGPMGTASLGQVLSPY